MESGKQNQVKQKTKLAGFQQIYVPDLLQERYPYLIQKEEKIRQEQEGQITKAVFFRTVPNLVEFLLQKQLNDDQIIECFLILNEIVSIQEKKIEMIDFNLIEISIEFLQTKNPNIIQECLSLIGSLVSISEGRKRFKNLNLVIIKQLFFHDNSSVRNSLGFMLTRLLSGQDGVSIFFENNLIESLIESFLKHSQVIQLDIEQQKFLLYFQQSIYNIMLDDQMTKCFIGKQLIQRFKSILKEVDRNQQLSKTNNEKISILNLLCIQQIVILEEGKEEGVQSDLMEILFIYLQKNNDMQILVCLRILMFLAINLKGKKEILDFQNGAFVKLVKRIDENKKENAEIQEIIEEVFTSLAEDILRFNKIYEEA